MLDNIGHPNIYRVDKLQKKDSKDNVTSEVFQIHFVVKVTGLLFGIISYVKCKLSIFFKKNYVNFKGNFNSTSASNVNQQVRTKSCLTRKQIMISEVINIRKKEKGHSVVTSSLTGLRITQGSYLAGFTVGCDYLSVCSKSHCTFSCIFFFFFFFL